MDRRGFLRQAFGLGMAALLRPLHLPAAAAPKADARQAKEQAMVLWFAHNVCTAASAGRALDGQYIADAVARCADNGINSIYWHPRYVGPAVYHSKVVAPFDDYFEKLWTEGTPTFKVNSGHRAHGKALADLLRRFDPYDVGVREVKRRGLRFIAQISPFDHWFPILPDRFYAEHPQYLLVDRTQTIHAPGLPCYAERGAQDHCLAEIRELIERGADGISLHMGSHQAGAWPSALGPRRTDSLGFNPPLVEEYERRYGVNVLKEDFDAAKWHALHGEFFTRFLRLVKKELKEKPLIVGVIPEGYLGYGGHAIDVSNPNYASRPAACRIDLEWRKWLQERTVDSLRVYTQKPNDVATVEAMKARANGGKVYFSRWVPAKEMAEVKQQIGRARSGVLDGCVLHEHSYFESNPKLWDVLAN